MENDLQRINQSDTADSLPTYQEQPIVEMNSKNNKLGSFVTRNGGGDVKVEDYPDEEIFVYKSQRKNLQLVRPPRSDALKLVSLWV